MHICSFQANAQLELETTNNNTIIENCMSSRSHIKKNCRWPGTIATVIMEQWPGGNGDWRQNYPRKLYTHSTMTTSVTIREIMYKGTYPNRWYTCLSFAMLLMCKCVNCMQCAMQTQHEQCDVCVGVVSYLFQGTHTTTQTQFNLYKKNVNKMEIPRNGAEKK